jgi:hypothetical protein
MILKINSINLPIYILSNLNFGDLFVHGIALSTSIDNNCDTPISSGGKCKFCKANEVPIFEINLWDRWQA